MNQMDEQVNSQSNAILKELSDIKSSLAVNTSETANIKVNMAEIKGDIKEIKNDYPNRRELNEALKTVREEDAKARGELKDKIDFQGKIIYSFVSLIVIVVMGAILKLVIK